MWIRNIISENLFSFSFLRVGDREEGDIGNDNGEEAKYDDANFHSRGGINEIIYYPDDE